MHEHVHFLFICDVAKQEEMEKLRRREGGALCVQVSCLFRVTLSIYVGVCGITER